VSTTTKEKSSVKKAKTTEEFDRRFDAGEDIFDIADSVKISRPRLEIRQINVNLPDHMVETLDRHAGIIGISRQSLIKVWLHERLNEEEGS
jgi:hypothetical protein